MNGYVEAGYVVVLGTLGTYGFSLIIRERAARRRVGARAVPRSPGDPTGEAPASRGGAPGGVSAR
ncbi:MAG: hypothetical protein ABSG36_06080 [Acidimicrobiales bacterium]|jgi:hypothetical protein